MFSDKDFAFALKVGSMSWRRIKTTRSYKRKTDRNWAKIIVREKNVNKGRNFQLSPASHAAFKLYLRRL